MPEEPRDEQVTAPTAGGFECVEPQLGSRLWNLDDPACEAELRHELELHLTICACCRLEHDTRQLVADALRSGMPVRRRGGTERRTWQRLVARGTMLCGTTLLAATLVFLVVLPPTDRSDGARARGPQTAIRFERPQSGEIVLGDQPTMAWNDVPRATEYRVTLTEIGGPWRWSGSTDASRLRVPAAANLPPDRPIRVVVETTPRDLLPPGGLSSSFERGNLLRVTRYRISHVPKKLIILATASFVFLITALGMILAPRFERSFDD